MTTPYIIQTKNLCKSYPNKDILKGCNLHVEEGTIYGLLGINGSGKTTLFKLFCGLLNITSGEATVLGKNIKTQREEILGQVGMLIETPIFYEHLSAQENLSLHLAYMGKDGSNIESILKRVGLDVTTKQAVSTFSLGMRQRLGVARAIVHNPKVLVLDEPINGLDPIGIREMRQLFKQLATEGMTIIISSHILAEIEHTVDVVGILANGYIAKEISMEEVRTEHPEGLEEYFIQIMMGGQSYV